MLNYMHLQIEVNEKLLSKVKELALRENLKMVLLFGSRATGTAKAESDIDFALSAGHALSEKDMLRFNHLFSEIASFDKVDMVDIMKAPPLLMKKIADSAKILYQKTSYEFPNFYIYALRRYYEAKSLFDLRRKQLQATIQHQ